MPMKEHAVVIAGGGPTGLMLAAELALAKVDVAIVERRTSQDVEGSRSGGLHARTIEVLDQRGIADRFLSEGQVAQVVELRRAPLDISDFPTRHNYGLGLWQERIERILADWVGELPVSIHRGLRGDGLRAGRRGRRRRAVRRPDAAGGVPRRLRRRAQPDPQARRHRVPGVGSDDELPDRRGRDDRGAGAGHAPRRQGHPRHRPARRRGAGADRGARSAARPHRRADPPRSQRGARSPSAERTTDCTVRPGSPDSPI